MTHVVISHHNHDHAYGAADFYENVNNGDDTLLMYNASAPFILGDEKFSSAAFGTRPTVHAGLDLRSRYEGLPLSWNGTAEAVLFNADVWSPGETLRFDLTGE